MQINDPDSINFLTVSSEKLFKKKYEETCIVGGMTREIIIRD